MNSPESKEIPPDNDPKLLNSQYNNQIERDPPDNDPQLLSSQYNNRIERDPPDNDPQLLSSQYDNKLHLKVQYWIRTRVVQERTFKQEMLHVSTRIIIIVLNR